MNNTIVLAKSKGGDGNTKHPPRIASSKIWCFTINNYTDKIVQSLASLYPKEAEYLGFQEEVGENGTPHLQGVIKFRKVVRPMEHVKFNCGFRGRDYPDESVCKPHWEKCRNFSASKEYCQKDDTRLKGSEPYIFPKPYNINIELYDWEKEIISIIETVPDDRVIYWYWSKSGCKGKTTFCKYLTLNHNAICLHGKGSDIRNGVLDYYNKSKKYPVLCVFPIPKSYNDEYLSYEGLENIKDMYFYSGKYEGGMVCGPCPHLFVFANVEPNLEMCSEDRWIVREIL